jgi:uncharacterized protein
MRRIGLFVALAFALSWIPAVLLAGAWGRADLPASSALLRASAVYAAVLGWQPIVAMLVVRAWLGDPPGLDRGLRSAPPRYQLLGVIAPLVLLGAAALVDAALGDAAPAARSVANPLGVVAALVSFVAVLSVLWLQAFSEELGWRSFLLGALMREIGSWPGLVVHGVLWGLWYAPVFLLAGDDSLARTASFVVTCALLGALLGWVRLASRSVLASAASNAVLTIGAGLPLILQGASSRHSAIYQPSGWIPMGAALLAIACLAPLRARVAVPLRELPPHVN